MSSGAAAALEVTEMLAAEDLAGILEGLIAFNEPFLGPHDIRPIAVLARQAGRLVGGLTGQTGRGFLEVELFWVEPDARRSGLGSRLLEAAEREAAARGCHSAWVGTYSFQAGPFYERHGYRPFGELTGFPNGHSTSLLVKRLVRPPGSSPDRATGTP